MAFKKRTFIKRLQQTSLLQRLVTVVIITTATIGLGLIGQGVYIKAKATLAQVLLEQAWGRALAGEISPKAWEIGRAHV